MIDPSRIVESALRRKQARNSKRRKARKQSRTSRSPLRSYESLEARELLTVTYHGGQLLQQVEAQAVYLGSDWNTNSSLKNQTQSVDQFVSYLVQSPYMDMLTQAGYGVGEGSATTGQLLNASLNKSAGISDAQIQADLQSAISSSQLATPDPNRLYVVYVEPGVVIKNGSETSQNTFLGYHGAFAGKDASGKSVDIHYAVIAYPGGSNPTSRSQGFSTDFNQLTDVTSHELAEAVVDPNVNYKTLGWYDDRLNGEIGDLTSRTTVLNGYVVQDLVNKNDQLIVPVATTPTSLTSPQNVSVTAVTSTQATVSWTGVTGAAGYRVYLVDGSGGTTLLTTVGPSSTSATIKGLTPGATESFKVEAYSGTTVADSNVASVTMPDQSALGSPNAVATAISYRSVQLSWGAVDGADGYRIYWMNGTQAVLLGTVSSSTNSVLVTGFTGGSTAQLMVEAFSGSLVADSIWTSVTTPAQPQSFWGNWWWWGWWG